MNKFLVFLEQREGVVKKSSVEIWNRVQELAASQKDSKVTGLIAGPADISKLNGCLVGEGTIFHASEEGFRLYNQEYYARLVGDMLKREALSALFFADSALSRDLAPRLSVRYQASLLSGCLDFSQLLGGGGCCRQVYSGLALGSFIADRNLRIYTLSSRWAETDFSAIRHIEFITLEPQLLYADDLVSVVQRIVMHEGMQDVAEAGIIVSGGRGMGSRDGFMLLEQLAALLGGAVGASRSAVDEGWRPHAEQIGQTGKTVTPSLYFACGISGAVQHLAGIGSAGIVVAINSDRDAPIFGVADYGIVGDVHVVLPKLIDAVKEFLKTK
jgi:electron transfer flavoprotein alpha subunit